MPRTDSARKAARQSLVRRDRRKPYATQMRTMMRKVLDAVKAGKKDDARSLLPGAYKAIDTAAKKHIIHPRTAGRKKSLIARTVAG